MFRFCTMRPNLRNSWDTKSPGDAYIVVLDRGGRVAYQTHGPTADAGYAELGAKVEALLK